MFRELLLFILAIYVLIDLLADPALPTTNETGGPLHSSSVTVRGSNYSSDDERCSHAARLRLEHEMVRYRARSGRDLALPTQGPSTSAQEESQMGQEQAGTDVDRPTADQYKPRTDSARSCQSAAWPIPNMLRYRGWFFAFNASKTGQELEDMLFGYCAQIHDKYGEDWPPLELCFRDLRRLATLEAGSQNEEAHRRGHTVNAARPELPQTAVLKRHASKILRLHQLCPALEPSWDFRAPQPMFALTPQTPLVMIHIPKASGSFVKEWIEHQLDGTLVSTDHNSELAFTKRIDAQDLVLSEKVFFEAFNDADDMGHNISTANAYGGHITMSFVDKLRQFERKAAANQSTTSNRIEPIAIVTLRDPLQRLISAFEQWLRTRCDTSYTESRPPLCELVRHVDEDEEQTRHGRLYRGDIFLFKEWIEHYGALLTNIQARSVAGLVYEEQSTIDLARRTSQAWPAGTETQPWSTAIGKLDLMRKLQYYRWADETVGFRVGTYDRIPLGGAHQQADYVLGVAKHRLCSSLFTVTDKIGESVSLVARTLGIDGVSTENPTRSESRQREYEDHTERVYNRTLLSALLRPVVAVDEQLLEFARELLEVRLAIAANDLSRPLDVRSFVDLFALQISPHPTFNLYNFDRYNRRWLPTVQGRPIAAITSFELLPDASGRWRSTAWELQSGQRAPWIMYSWDAKALLVWSAALVLYLTDGRLMGTEVSRMLMSNSEVVSKVSLWHGALKAWPQQVRFGYRNGDEMGQHTVAADMMREYYFVVIETATETLAVDLACTRTGFCFEGDNDDRRWPFDVVEYQHILDLLEWSEPVLDWGEDLVLSRQHDINTTFRMLEFLVEYAWTHWPEHFGNLKAGWSDSASVKGV